ncbi:hypothetical protein ACQPYK_49620 (plasmid) [Streptosporangium sp. CA-135522]|uniref:hypothetical protein n=1 Tax=Streptosporangium sp. CA-135522 TaxID=3240072 RepID=UPI003D910655
MTLPTCAAFRTEVDLQPAAVEGLDDDLGYGLVLRDNHSHQRCVVAGTPDELMMVIRCITERAKAVFGLDRRHIPDQEPAPIRPVVFGPHQAVDVAVLAPGCVVRRWTESDDPDAWDEDGWTYTGSAVRTTAPCCSRTIRVALEHAEQDGPLMCPWCRVLYQAALIQEDDGGYLACFTVQAVDVPMVPRRTRKRCQCGDSIYSRKGTCPEPGERDHLSCPRRAGYLGRDRTTRPEPPS